MTRDRDFKRLLRERAARTGESYVTARRNFRSTRDGAVVDAGWQIPMSMASTTGLQLTPEEASVLEAHVATHEADVRARAKLLGYYFKNRNRPEHRLGHVIWFITNKPRWPITGSPVCYLDCSIASAADYQLGASLWLAHLENSPDDPQILAVASDWFTLVDRELSTVLAERVVELTDGDVRARLALAQQHRLSGIPRQGEPQEVIATARRVLDALGDRPAGDEQLPKWVRMAAWAHLAAGELEEAQQCADELLRITDGQRLYGNEEHEAYLVRGHVALQKGHLIAAEGELLRAATTTDTRTLNIHRPNLSLARSLLEHGRAEAVITFLQQCRRFCQTSTPLSATPTPSASRMDEQMGKWIEEIRSGLNPDFGPDQLPG